MDNNKITSASFKQVLLLDPEQTNLPVYVNVMNRGTTRLPARLYISADVAGSRVFGMTIADVPNIFGKSFLNDEEYSMVRDWMFLNWDLLIESWLHDSPTEEYSDELLDWFKKL